MFTGIIEETGQIESIKRTREITLVIKTKTIAKKAKSGDSIAVNGVCLTVTKIENNLLSFNVMTATINNTTLKELKQTQLVNLERAATLNTPLGGHLVSGHVDTVGIIKKIKKEPEQYSLVVGLKKGFEKYLVDKGSIALDGISLTIQKKQGNIITLGIIPHTLENTNLKNKKISDNLNIEFDMHIKYLDNLINEKQKATSNKLKKMLW